MGKVLGNKRKCYVGSGRSWLKGEVNNSVNINGNLVETSDKTNGWQAFLQGIKGATATVTVHVDTASNSQNSLLTALTAGTQVEVFIGDLDGGSGYAFDALVASVDETNDNGSVASRTINLTATGAVTIAGLGSGGAALSPANNPPASGDDDVEGDTEEAGDDTEAEEIQDTETQENQSE